MRGTSGQRSCSSRARGIRGGSRGPIARRSAPRRSRTARCSAASSRRQEALRQQALGRDVEQVELAGEQAALDLAAALAASSEDSGRPRARRAARSASTWSCISAISGETTMPVPRAAAPASGSTATCRRRSASAPGIAAGDARARRSPPAGRGSRRSRRRGGVFRGRDSCAHFFEPSRGPVGDPVACRKRRIFSFAAAGIAWGRAPALPWPPAIVADDGYSPSPARHLPPSSAHCSVAPGLRGACPPSRLSIPMPHGVSHQPVDSRQARGPCAAGAGLSALQQLPPTPDRGN